MKKLALLAGLTGFLAVGAFAQQSSDTSAVSFTVGTWRNIDVTANPSAFAFTGGEFFGSDGPWDTASDGSFTVMANTTWSATWNSITVSFSGPGYTADGGMDTWTMTGTPGPSGGPGSVTYPFAGRLTRTAVDGRDIPGAGQTVSGTITITIGA